MVDEVPRPYVPAPSDFADNDVAWTSGYDRGWRAGCRYAVGAVSRLRPKRKARLTLTPMPVSADKLNGHQAQTTANGSDKTTLPF